MGTDGEDGKGPGKFSVQGRAEAHEEATVALERKDLVLPFVGGRDEGGRYCSDLDVNPPDAEYSRAIYCNTADYGPVQKGQPTAGRMGSLSVVGTDRD